MTIRKAESITGLRIQILPDLYRKNGWTYAVGYDPKSDSREILRDGGFGEGKALKALVEANYKRVSEIVRVSANHRCSECGRMGSLEIDHIAPRARGGRDDRISNLRAVCASFTGCGVHQRKHG